MVVGEWGCGVMGDNTWTKETLYKKNMGICVKIWFRIVSHTSVVTVQKQDPINMKIVRQQAYCCVHVENEISTFAFIYINTLHTLPSKKVPTYISTVRF